MSSASQAKPGRATSDQCTESSKQHSMPLEPVVHLKACNALIHLWAFQALPATQVREATLQEAVDAVASTQQHTGLPNL